MWSGVWIKLKCTHELTTTAWPTPSDILMSHPPSLLSTHTCDVALHSSHNLRPSVLFKYISDISRPISVCRNNILMDNEHNLVQQLLSENTFHSISSFQQGQYSSQSLLAHCATLCFCYSGSFDHPTAGSAPPRFLSMNKWAEDRLTHTAGRQSVAQDGRPSHE